MQLAQCQQQQQNFTVHEDEQQQRQQLAALGSAANNSSSSSLSSSDNNHSDFSQHQQQQIQHQQQQQQQQQCNGQTGDDSRAVQQAQQYLQNPLLSGALLGEHEHAIEHADHEEHNLLHNALMRSPEKLKLIDSIITLLNYASNYNQKMLQPLLEIKRCIERDLEVVLSDTSNSVAANSCCRQQRSMQFDQQQQQQQLAAPRRPLMALGGAPQPDGLCIRADELAAEAAAAAAACASPEQASAVAGNSAMQCVRAQQQQQQASGANKSGCGGLSFGASVKVSNNRNSLENRLED